MKKGLAAVILFLAIWGSVYSYNRMTDGFSVRQMTSKLPDNPEYALPPLAAAKKEELQNIVSQPYRYLGKGCQFYVFESEDGKYVLKFFKHKHLRSVSWMNLLPLSHAYVENRIAKREMRIHNLFTSCKLAYEVLPEETGVLFVHLLKTPALEQNVKLVDKMGFAHEIALDQFEFVLQKRALHVDALFHELLAQHEEENIKEKIQQLINLIEKRCDKGIRDRDRSFVQNVAFSAGEERAVFVDIGQFYYDESIKEPEQKQKDLLRRLSSLRAWTIDRAPALTAYVEERIEQEQVIR